MSDGAITTLDDREGRVEGFRRKIDQLAVFQVTAASLDPAKRKNHELTERRMVEELRENAASLAGPSLSPLVSSLALTVALCEADMRTRQTLNGPLSNNHDGQRNLDRSMRRYLAACRTLALVAKLNLPSIQVNLATNQVVSNG